MSNVVNFGLMVEVKIEEGKDKYPIIPLIGNNQGEVMCYTNDGVYLLDVKLNATEGVFSIVGRYRGAIPESFKDLGRDIIVSKETGEFLFKDNMTSLTSHRMVGLFGNSIKAY